MSQLRQVCKRIVVLLRSLHCLTRMLPSYRLKCLLLSNMTASGTAAAGGGGAGGGFHIPVGLMGPGNNNVNAGAVGWGTIGFSIHISDFESEPSLPSPSFARHSLPLVSTPHGNLRLTVMYDATLKPNDMIADLAERRSEWIQRRWAELGGGGGRHQQYVEQRVTLTSTQPIPIAQVRSNTPDPLSQHGRLQQQQQQQRQTDIHGQREYGSCPPKAAHLGGPASLGSAGSGGRSRAVSDFIISDYQSNSPRLKQRGLLTSPGSGEEVEGKKPQEKRVLSGLSLAMMNEEQQGMNQNTSNHGGQHQQQEQEEEIDNIILAPFGSPATRAAFHNPPPVYSPDENIQHAQSYDDHGGTHFFNRHSGYGYAIQRIEFAL